MQKNSSLKLSGQTQVMLLLFVSQSFLKTEENDSCQIRIFMLRHLELTKFVFCATKELGALLLFWDTRPSPCSYCPQKLFASNYTPRQRETISI